MGLFFWVSSGMFWKLDGVYSTNGRSYAGGHTPNATYQEVCSGPDRAYNEVVRVVPL